MRKSKRLRGAKGKLIQAWPFSQSDFVLHLPLRYEDETQVTSVALAPNGGSVQLEVEVRESQYSFVRAASSLRGWRTAVAN